MVMVNQILEEVEEDDRMLTVAVLQTIYPELSIKEVFELLNDFLLLETLIIEMSAIPTGSIDELDWNG